MENPQIAMVWHFTFSEDISCNFELGMCGYHTGVAQEVSMVSEVNMNTTMNTTWQLHQGKYTSGDFIIHGDQSSQNGSQYC